MTLADWPAGGMLMVLLYVSLYSVCSRGFLCPDDDDVLSMLWTAILAEAAVCVCECVLSVCMSSAPSTTGPCIGAYYWHSALL